MNFETVETYVRASFEPLQYAAFFGVFAVFDLAVHCAQIARDGVREG